MPRVSIVVSHYGRQDELGEALASIARQIYQDFEVIVVNDHGVDSRGLVSEFAARLPGFPPSRVHYDYRARNCGVAATRNRGIALAQGELIAHLDDDDLWGPRHLASLVAALDAEPDADLAYGDAEVWRMECGAAAGASRWNVAERRTLAVPFDLDDLGRDDFIVPGGMLHRRALVDRIGGFDETLYVSDDWDWLLRAARVTRFVRVPQVVITVRIWPADGNLSACVDARRLAALAELERRYNLPKLEPKTFWEVAATYAAAQARSASRADGRAS